MAYQGRQPGVGVRNRFIYSATGGQTSFSGADSNGLTLAYSDATYVDVFLNGTLLVPVTDYAATTKTSVVLGSGAAASDIVEIVAYDISSMSDAITSSSGGTITGNLTVEGNFSADGGSIKLDGNYPVGTANLALGDAALDDGSLSGNYNTALGAASFGNLTSGTANLAVGAYAGQNHTTGSYNVFVGEEAAVGNTTGNYNTAVGRTALYSNTTASNNTAVGYQAGYSNTTGDKNSAFGMYSLYSNTTGTQNTAHGYAALFSNTTASNNTAVGFKALDANTTGTENHAFGSYALDANTTGNSNSAYGLNSLGANTTASNNSAYGVDSLRFNTGASNTAVGKSALQSNTTASNNTAVGYTAGYSNTTGAQNTSLGMNALYGNTTGSDNTAIGQGTLQNNTTGGSNVAVGRASLGVNTTGSNNTTLGKSALNSNTTSNNNTAVGYQAMYSYQTGGDNVAFGVQAGYSLNGNGNSTFIGRSSGFETTGATNTFVGYNSGYAVSTGSKNTILGVYNGNQNGLDIRTSNNQVVLSDGDGNVRLHINEFGNAEANGTLAISPTFSTTTSMNDVLRINSSSSGSAGVGHGSAIYFLGERNDGNTQAMAKIGSIATTNSGSSFAAALVFHAGPSGVPVERVRINSNGRISTFGTGNVNASLNLLGEGGSSFRAISFEHTNGGGEKGSISTSSSSTSYNTSSDHRLKENVDYTWDATTRLKQLKPARFNFISDADTIVDGFLAHEAQAVVPEAVHGTHNEVEVWEEGDELPDGVSVGDNKLDDDGNTIPVMQGIDQSKLVPLLVKTIQELEARITVLEG